MYRGMNGLGAVERAVGRIPQPLLRKVASDLDAAYRAAPDRKRFVAEQHRKLVEAYNKLLKDLEALESEAVRVNDASLRAQIWQRIHAMEEGLSVLRGLLTDRGEGGLGAAAAVGPVAKVAIAITQMKPLLALLAPIGLAVAISLAIILIEGKDQITNMFGPVGEAVKTGMVVVTVAAGFLMVVWTARIVRDIWGPKEKRERAEPVPARPVLRPAPAAP